MSASLAQKISSTDASDWRDNTELLLARLDANKKHWTQMGRKRRMAILERCIQGVLRVAPQWVEATCATKGLSCSSPLSGEAWLSGPMPVIRNLRLLKEALKAKGSPAPTQSWRRASGQHVAEVFPRNVYDRVMFSGFRAEQWIMPGQEPSQGRIYQKKPTLKQTQKEPGIALVLSAGNISSIGPMDALHKLFVENEVVLMKTNPVNASIAPFIERGFAPLIELGVFAIVDGDAEVGHYLCHHPLIDSIHITGSDKTHDAIVWGSDKTEQKRRKEENQPVLEKPITSELGCVTPILVVPGPWSESDLDYHAQQLASMVAHNASFNCNAAQVIVTAQGWPLRDQFIERIKTALSNTPARRAYYPGAAKRYENFLEHYPQAQPLSKPAEDSIPWTFIDDVPPEPGEYAFREEAFCGLVTHTSVEANEALDFLETSVPFINEHIWGTLSCSMLVHPQTRKAHNQAVDNAIEKLRYGSIGINLWPGVIYGLVSPGWGAFPGHSLTNIESGRGFVHNTHLFDHLEKSVVHAPFQVRPTPAWFANHRTLDQLGKSLTEFEARPSLRRLANVLKSALRG